MAALVAGATAALTLVLMRTVLFGEETSHPPVYDWPGFVAALVLTPLAGLLGSRLGGDHLHDRLSLPVAAQTGLYGALIWLSIETTVRAAGSLGLGRVLDNVVAGDMLAVMVGMPLAAWVIALYGQHRGVRPRDWGYTWSPARLAVGVAGGLLILALMWGTALVDEVLWGGTGVLPPAMVEGLRAGAWVSLLMLAVNGLIVPASEELAWRGVIQTAFGRAWGPLVGLLLTAIVFALKHVVVDGSVARVTTLLMIGLVVGAVRFRWGTGASTIAHMVANLGATALVIWTVADS
jgi:membrane protease YdiL (CAAX protease family)